MTTSPNEGKPPKRRFFSARHARGWLIATACFVAFVMAVRMLAIIAVAIILKDPMLVLSDVDSWSVAAILACGVLAFRTLKSGVEFHSNKGTIRIGSTNGEQASSPESAPPAHTCRVPHAPPKGPTKQRLAKSKISHKKKVIKKSPS